MLLSNTKYLYAWTISCYSVKMTDRQRAQEKNEVEQLFVSAINRKCFSSLAW